MTLTEKLRKLKNTALLAGAVVGIPLVYDLDGCSTSQAKYLIKEQRQVLSKMSKRPEFSEEHARFSYGGNLEDIKNNISYIDTNKEDLERLTRFSLDFGLGLIILAGIANGMYLKKELANLSKSD